MKRVNHINVIEVGSCCLISQIDRVLERNVPDRESLKLGITGLDSTLVLVVKL